MRVIYRGQNWPYAGKDPCSKEMIGYLERNESIISWLQVQSPDAKVEDQTPVIIVGDSFCPLSLRMMKAVWRHVRLRKDFVNTECISDGSLKLKIPQQLLREKIRTQARFNVCIRPICVCQSYMCVRVCVRVCIYRPLVMICIYICTYCTEIYIYIHAHIALVYIYIHTRIYLCICLFACGRICANARVHPVRLR